MPYITVGTEKTADIALNYVDYGEGKPVVLIHGWPLSHQMFEKQITALVEAGRRVIAYDRRGFGESSQSWDGYDYDTFAADLDTLLTDLDLYEVTLVGFSMGGGEVARYIGTYGEERIEKAVLFSAITPYMLKTEDNPTGVDQSVFDGMLEAMTDDRLSFLMDFSKQFINYDKDGKDLVSEEALRHSWDIAAWASPRATVECAKAFASTDFRDDLAKITVPTLVLHGDADAVVPMEASGDEAHKLIDNSEMVIIEGGAHGLTYTQPDAVNTALLNFLNK